MLCRDICLTCDVLYHSESKLKMEQNLNFFCVFSHLQTKTGFERSVQASEHDLAKKLKSNYMTQVAAHLTLQQLQVFSCDMLRSILAFHETTSSPSSSEDSEHTDQQCL